MNMQWKAAIPWALTGLVSTLAVYAWGQSLAWDLHNLNAYLLFPVLGLLAYSIMWSHYMIGSIKHTPFMRLLDLTNYFRYTGYAVLVAIVLHPGLLVYQLFRDGHGLPPGSYEHYVAPGLAWVTLLGTASLLVFLAFELHRWYGRASWWKYVIAAGDIAMLAIFYHSLRLGTQLQGGWFRLVWWFYGLSLAVVLVRKYTWLLLHKPGIDQTTDW